MTVISLVVCSVNPDLLKQFRLNVAQTIGVPFEVIAIENQNNHFSICSAYNRGGRAANYPFICFVHEDVLFLTENWGKKIISHLTDPKTGLIGLAGGDAKPALPSSWSSCLHSNQINIIQCFKQPTRLKLHLRVTDGDSSAVSQPVIALDGVFLGTRQDIFAKFQFDEQLLTGFHGYDNDYSLAVGQQYSVKVIFDVDLEHLSEGSLNREWISSQLLVYRKWKKSLPRFVCPPGRSASELYHWKSFQVYIEGLIKLNYSNLFIWQEVFRYSFNGFFNIRRLGSLCKYILLTLKSAKSS